jgi:hypothetical protein
VSFAKQKNHRCIAAAFHQPTGWLLRDEERARAAWREKAKLAKRWSPH